MSGMDTATSTATADRTLPVRPRLAPGIGVYRRADDELQVGVDPRRAVVLTGSAPLAAVIVGLDGRRALSDVVDDAAAAERVDGDLVRDVLARLHERGLVVDAAQQRGGPVAVAVRGDGPIAVATALTFARAGVGHLIVESDGVVAARDLGHPFAAGELGRSRRDAVCDLLRATNPQVMTQTLPSDRSPDLVVLADVLAPPPTELRDLMCHRQPHVAARARDGIGIVGPLVLPGRTSCLTCADLHRADRDREWPLVANQLIGVDGEADEPTAQAVAAVTVAQAAMLFDGGRRRPGCWNATIEWDVASGGCLTRPWQPHPRCSCGATSPW